MTTSAEIASPTAKASMPVSALLLGLAGLIPFWALAFAFLGHDALGFDGPPIDLALATYAAVIISFVGGIRWGLAVRGPAGGGQYAVSVIPSLLAWAVLAAPEPWRLASLGVLTLVLGPIDHGLVRAGLAPSWYGRLRLVLSTGAGVALLLAAFL